MKRIDRLHQKIAEADAEVAQARQYAEEIERQADARAADARRELEIIEAMPDWDLAPEGTVAAVVLTYGPTSRKPYTYILFKSAGTWTITGQTGKFSADGLSEFLTSRTRRVQDFRVLAEIGTFDPTTAESVVMADLGALLAAVRSIPFPGSQVPDGDRD